MEIPVNIPTIRTFNYIKKRTLKDGTVKEYVCTGTYEAKTLSIHADKTEMRKKITDCKDKEKLKLLREYMDQINI